MISPSKNLIISFLSLWFSSISTFAQSPKITFNQHIKPIIYKNCTPCHQPNNVAPFSLLSYEDVAKRGNFISKITQARYMPPFPADRKFQNYLNERGLTIGEIAKIKLWVENGMEKGEEVENGELFKTKNSELKKADLHLKMQKPFTTEGNNQEEFRFFSIPTNHLKDEYIEAVEFIPGNKNLVHHSRLMVDTTNLIRGIDGMAETDERVKEFQKTALKDEFLYGWVPGNDIIYFPKGTGRKLNANSDFILNMHYAPSPIVDSDQSEIRLYFAKEKVDREVKTLILRENDISNQPFLIKAETTPTFYISYKIEKDLSLISIMPHMHLIGKSFVAFAVTPSGEVINLIKIDTWDFNWQMTYQFKKLLKIPAGSQIMVQATYDNTSENPENPFAPAKDIGYGWGTRDEMLNLVMYYLDYKADDENIEQKNN